MADVSAALNWDGASSMKWGKLPLQQQQNVPPLSAYHCRDGTAPVHRNHRRPASSTPLGKPRLQHTLDTDVISQYRPPTGTLPSMRDPSKFDAMGTTAGWVPHSANLPGFQRAVYDPVSHKTTLYTFKAEGGVDRAQGRGDTLLREKKQRDLNEGRHWHGRRKGVVEFVDRTHFYAVNANHDFLKTCARNEFAYHPQKGELSHWMDVAISTRVQPAPFKT